MEISEPELTHGINSQFWKVFKEEMEIMRENILETLAVEKDDGEFHKAQGRAEVLRDLMIWPEVELKRFQDDNK